MSSIMIIYFPTQKVLGTEKSLHSMCIWKLFLEALNDIINFVIQDNFGRLHDRSKETPKTMKQLTRLFPNKITIQMPQVNTTVGV